MSVCNICGGNQFISGPGGRLSTTKKLPKCSNCFSLERHRSLRQIYLKLLPHIPADTMKVLQISEDKAIQPKWFKSLELSVYDGLNSIDIQNIDRLNQSYDIVICNHVLEHVADDIKSLKELMRIVKRSGFLQLAVPDPLHYLKTRDWGYPDEIQHGHYRIYGSDIKMKFEQAIPKEVYQLDVVGIDPVTGTEDIYFFFTYSEVIAQVIQEKINQVSTIPKIINFQSSGNATLYQVYGWHRAEKSGTWTSQQDATLVIQQPLEKLTNVQEDLKLLISGLPFLTEKQPKNSVQILCNNEIIADLKFFLGDGLREIEVIIPKHLVTNDESLEIVFRCQYLNSPKSLDIGADPRKLGFFIHEIKFVNYP